MFTSLEEIVTNFLNASVDQEVVPSRAGSASLILLFPTQYYPPQYTYDEAEDSARYWSLLGDWIRGMSRIG